MAPPQDATIRVEPGSTTDERVVSVAGEIDVASSPALRDTLGSLVDDGARRIVVDLHDTTFVDSAGLGVLVGAHKRLRDERGGELVLRRMQDAVRRVFVITGLATVLSIDAG